MDCLKCSSVAYKYLDCFKIPNSVLRLNRVLENSRIFGCLLLLLILLLLLCFDFARDFT